MQQANLLVIYNPKQSLEISVVLSKSYQNTAV
jgi:hypothetical protein